MNETTRTAVEVARKAGVELRRSFERPLEIDRKSHRELVTDMDRASEEIIVGALSAAFPDDTILAEESAPEAVESESVWIVDPLDGTNNYAHGYPFFSVAIGLEERGVMSAGVVYDPLRDEVFAGERGGGATLNGEPICVSAAAALSDSLVATGFPYGRSEDTDNNLENLNRFVLAARGIRRGGSAELDLVYVACGRLDGFWELGLKTWDVSAGGLIVLEAGGRVSNFDGGAWDNRRGDIVASNGLIHDEMVRLAG